MSTPSPEYRDSPDTRLRRLATQFGLDREQTFILLREADDILAASPEIVRLRALNRGLVDSHNSLLVALARSEENAEAHRRALDDAEADFSTSSLLLTKQAGYALTRFRRASPDPDPALDEIAVLIDDAVALHEKKAPRD